MTPTGGTDVDVKSPILTEEEECPLKVQSSWLCATENDLKNTIILQKDSENADDPTSLMSVKTCALLTRERANDDGGSDCSIVLQLSGNAVMSSLSVLSEARLVETYGLCDEYLNTVRAEFLLDVEDTLVYCADVKLDNPSNCLTLKLNRLTRVNEVWIYGIIVRWKNTSRSSIPSLPCGVPYPTFDLEAVDRRLTELGPDLSKNAQQCKKFLEMFNDKSGDGSGDRQAVKPQFTALLASMFSGNRPREAEKKQTQQSTSISSLENLLDQKLVALEHRIMAAIDQRILALERRQHKLISDGFDKIMQQFQSNPCSSSNRNKEQDQEAPNC